ncbi:PiggyBac transposable element-derived protein 4-like protein [Leptotrombidium deliense]|uniref:PiggyBac transposable element-derived protein 4-like protein n=1 Tax=Leptotrombidium deliense TaxID=299467 RepID=A0A443SGV6_9ACAR|nr:PiggyBac transposable element-derived protein 4-like protein [Leptotrombidium deliense]
MFLKLLDPQMVELNVRATNQRVREKAELYSRALDALNNALDVEALPADVRAILSRNPNTAYLRKMSTVNTFSYNEVLAIYGYSILMGIERRRSECDVHELRGNNIFSFPAAACATTRKRIQLFNTCFGICERERERELYPLKVAKVYDFVQRLRENFVKAYVPDCALVVDEHIIRFKGRVSFAVYMPNKPDPKGIKLWMMCDRYNYVCNFQIYSGEEGERVASGGERTREINQTSRVVTDMLSVLPKNRQYHVTTDRFFTSQNLANKLWCQNITLLGTMRKSQKEIPLPLRERDEHGHKYDRPADSSMYAYQMQCTILSRSSKSKKLFFILSTRHYNDSYDNEANLPRMVVDYNKSKCYVDVADQLVKNYTCERKTKKWTLAVFRRLLDFAAHNAKIIHDVSTMQRDNGSRPDKRKHFLACLAMELIAAYATERFYSQSIPRLRKLQIHKYFDIPMPDISGSIAGVETIRKRCFACGPNSNNKTRYVCSQCSMYVCRKHCNVTYITSCLQCLQLQTVFSDAV